MKEHPAYYTAGLLSLDYLDQLNLANDYRVMRFNNKNVTVRVKSLRFTVFKQSHICYICGLEATHLQVEICKSQLKFTTNHHINMYGIDSKGNLVLFTKDHVITKVNGGTNDLSNLKTCCTICNQKKANK